MQPNQTTVQSSGGLSGPAGATQMRAEEFHVRNFDDDRSYDLSLTVRMDGHPVVENTYHLTPGRRVSERSQLTPGVYEVTVCLDGEERVGADCEIGTTPERTALVEVGNGVVSVTQGLY